MIAITLVKRSFAAAWHHDPLTSVHCAGSEDTVATLHHPFDTFTLIWTRSTTELRENVTGRRGSGLCRLMAGVVKAASSGAACWPNVKQCHSIVPQLCNRRKTYGRRVAYRKQYQQHVHAKSRLHDYLSLTVRNRDRFHGFTCRNSIIFSVLPCSCQRMVWMVHP